MLAEDSELNTTLTVNDAALNLTTKNENDIFLNNAKKLS